MHIGAHEASSLCSLEWFGTKLQYPLAVPGGSARLPTRRAGRAGARVPGSAGTGPHAGASGDTIQRHIGPVADNEFGKAAMCAWRLRSASHRRRAGRSPREHHLRRTLWTARDTRDVAHTGVARAPRHRKAELLLTDPSALLREPQPHRTRSPWHGRSAAERVCPSA